ncbi:sensor histidine kinase [Microbispora rosea]|uniref:histidine kinase n=1 Tax=Microbispora rosea TaxID=58117 RepID=A0A1N6SUJ1_9ACTN|nr:sensor histidine kinase [Microbispora rosea]GIH45309.1 two-component sensor histidine kinase [Microbispora rosea subsp. rosea]SIQ44684.1 Signal transduction histidine kinase [Microbispora rosea]
MPSRDGHVQAGPESSRRNAIAGAFLRLAVIALLVGGQATGPPGFGLTGDRLAITALTAAIAVTLSLMVVIRLRPILPGRWNDGPAEAVLVGLTIVAAIALDMVSDSGPAVAVLMFAVGAAAVRHPLRWSLPLLLLALAGLGSSVAGLLPPPLTPEAQQRDLSLCVSICVVFAVAFAIRQRRAATAAQAGEAVLAERARIAREIHDILAHSLSAQIVHLEGARLLLRADRSQEALDRVERARELAKQGLDEARRAVAALRDDAQPLPAALDALAGEFRDATGRECAVVVSGHERRLPPETELAMIRTAQEAVTNVRRHAPGSPATVRLSFGDRTCELEVVNPPSDAPGTPGGGYGLVGMRERAELLGGTLEAGETEDGFLVRLRVPA